MVKKATSHIEQALYYYVRQFFPDAINRYKVNECVEADIYIPSIKVAVEYDGVYWHKGKVAQDNEKNRYFQQYAIFTIRVRDCELPTLDPFFGRLFSLWTKTKHLDVPGYYPSDCITAVLHELSNHVDDSTLKQQLLTFTLSFDEYNDNYSVYLAGIFTDYVEDNITKSCAFKYWDSEKNNPLKPENVPMNTSQYVWVVCNNGDSKHVHVHNFFGQRYCCNNCEECTGSICPMLSYCEGECDYCNSIVDAYVDGKSRYSDIIMSQIVLCHWSYSKKNIESLKKLETGACNDSEKIALEKLYRLDRTTGSIHINSVITNQDLEFIKKFMRKHPSVLLFFYPDGFDESQEGRCSLINFCRWAIMEFAGVPENVFDMASRILDCCIGRRTISQNLFEMIVALYSDSEVVAICNDKNKRFPFTAFSVVERFVSVHPEIIFTDEMKERIIRADNKYTLSESF